jgi:hypothetical protein
LDKDDGLPWSEEVGHHADHFQIKLLYLVARKYGVGITLHSSANLVERKDLIGLRERSDGKENGD